jgi:hypothetical protein
MLGFVSIHIPWKAISNLELRRSYKGITRRPIAAVSYDRK